MSDFTWRENLCRALRQYLPWAQLPDAFALPILRMKPMMTDSDVDFAGDMIYARSLHEDIQKQRKYGNGGFDPWPRILTITLDAALEIVRGDFADDAGAAIAEWRNENRMRAAA